MIERKRLDRPELREKIFRIVDGANFKQGPTSDEATDQILALIPDIEETKKQERERIEDLFDSEPTHCTFIKTQGVEECYVIRVKDWQALGEK